MANITLVTGGARSGKSGYSETLAKKFTGSRAYIATSPVVDDEMAKRVALHQEQRKHDGWVTIEEEVDLIGAIRQASSFDTILVDCLTLWINNLIFHSETKLSEADIKQQCIELEDACAEYSGNIIFVINEVGMGIVPDNPLARQFRDLSGRCSQTIAGFADSVILMSCGLPLTLK
jgi:adenosylcobinamide kinase/adenosylcobinamide-phosphate guanylyltransferase